ncbi:MAG TPA: helix-turn-helix domain-containing protein [Gemmatimonadales bacterium]|jgi:transposase|nr:helix-turn-helix domain-containing protein [Gemmatimonadales bacterium]
MALLTLTPLQRAGLEDLLVHTPSARELCRVQALLWLADGADVDGVAESLGISRQTVYNWVGRFQERSGLDPMAGLRDAPRSGRPRAAGGRIDGLVAAVIGGDPRKHGYNATTWTAPLLGRYLSDRHGIEVCDRTVGRAIDRLRIRWKRPRHELSLRPKTWRQSKGG